ncbi:ABC transporter ATP-binding protein/permease [Metallumcola ferriviriculae]|uniref:ABC transporter ATP-binding protein/permease n=1 Tax=Metallumcola ferriviriculae TaxID=3039180 RepID=A0AAU0UQC7_9FIRM|nr:ABC transporter ATP-binding protein/permease [Desulfitibacteraceae bacterium MK1]
MLKLTRYLKPYTLSITAVFILLFIQSLSQLYLPTLMSDIVDIGIVQGDTRYIFKVGVVMLFIAAGGTVATIAASYLSAKSATGFGKILRNKVFTHIESFSLQGFNKIGTASLITRTTNDITQVQQVTMLMLRMVISAPMMIIGGVIMAVSKDAQLSIIILVVIPLLSVAIFVIARKGLPLFKALQVKLDKLNRVLRESLTGIRVIRAFNRSEYESVRFNRANGDLTGTAINVNHIMVSMMPVMMFLFNLTTIAVVWFGSIRINNGSMQVGDLMAFIQYVTQIMFSLIMISVMFVMVPRASASALRINEILNMEADIKDPQCSQGSEGKRGVVQFKDVTFRYPGAEEPVVNDITFTTFPGEVTAVIGGTGSGKSTLINLIPRFFDVESGSVKIDGVDVRDMTQKELRAKIGFIPQEAVLFTGTTAENIRYGKETATDEEVKRAAEIAQATEFISTMKDGFQSLIAQGGINISGGQKQRISIARALVRKPEIYVFDDSFSALDLKTEANLRAALKKEILNSTIIIVAQRVSTVVDADRIIVLDQGRIAGIGCHKDLLEKCKVYREIVVSQLSEEELA